MNQVMVTIVAPLDPARLPEAERAIDLMGNPSQPALAQSLDVLQGDLGIHFVGLHAIPSFTQGRAHLLLELSADGDADRTIAQLVAAIGGALRNVFHLARDWANGDIAAYLSQHIVQTGFGLAATPGVSHCGTPGMTVGRIRSEAALTHQIDTILASQRGGMSGLARLDAVRSALGSSSPALAPGEPPTPFSPTSIPRVICAGILSFVKIYLGPWLLGLAVIWLALFLIVELKSYRLEAAGCVMILCGAMRALKLGGLLLLLFLLAFAAFIGVAYACLRRKEANDWISTRAPDRDILHAIIARENAPSYAHNHMMSLTELKPGWLRSVTLRLVFWVIATIGPLLYKPGYLGLIGSIHFARWITLPKTRDFVFLSNYGGSWESYLEDFITLAHNGLTGIWSNTVGFPKTVNLIGEGASDGERFKRRARQSMLPTRFWYSAYPGLNTDMIRANSAVRLGLSSAMTEDDAAAWLSRFGSALRPPTKLVSSDIQSLLFGGLGFLPFASCTFWRLPSGKDAARRWLGAIKHDIAWNDGRRLRDNDKEDGIYQLAVSAEGLAALGLPEEGLNSFPPAFLDGMDTPSRARILGDVGANAQANWWWKERADVVVLVYGEDQPAFAVQRRKLSACGAAHGATLIHEVELEPQIPNHNVEPFGFADGVSQPVIRGTYKGERNNPHSMHIVEPGEFILGYPDNRGNLPPGPSLPAIHDPANLLPVRKAPDDFDMNTVNCARDLGFNGSFLVIRQLEQDVKGFSAYCDGEAQRLRTRLGAPYEVTPDFIAGKMVGRWRNGVPLVRAPYSPPVGNSKALHENDFQLGFEDPEGLRCPFGAHIRRTNPRDSLNPGSEEQIGITNRHRMTRVGRKYVAKEGQNPGLLFMCLNGDLERQFEFVQQTWIHGNVISLSCPMNLSTERDPLLNDGQTNNAFTIPSRDGPVKLSPMQRFVTVRGGGYFFLLGRQLVEYLSS